MRQNTIMLAVPASCTSYDLFSISAFSQHLVCFFLQHFCLCKKIKKQSLSSETSYYQTIRQFTFVLMKIQFSIEHLIFMFFQMLYHLEKHEKNEQKLLFTLLSCISNAQRVPQSSSQNFLRYHRMFSKFLKGVN